MFLQTNTILWEHLKISSSDPNTAVYGRFSLDIDLARLWWHFDEKQV